MDDPQLLDMMEEVARLVRGKPDVLMGGIRVDATGDVMQLPPLGTAGEAGRSREIYPPNLLEFNAQLQSDRAQSAL